MTTDDDAPVFVDTNVLVYANADIAPQHDVSFASLRLLQQDGVILWISR